MNINNSISIFEIISILGVLGSFFYSWIINKQTKRSTDASNEIAISNRISSTLQETRRIKEKIMINKENTELLADLKLIYEESYEDYLTAYNESCQYYFDNKIDKNRFVSRYFRDIQRIIEEDKYYKEYSHNFGAIKRFYDEKKQND